MFKIQQFIYILLNRLIGKKHFSPFPSFLQTYYLLVKKREMQNNVNNLFWLSIFLGSHSWHHIYTHTYVLNFTSNSILICLKKEYGHEEMERNTSVNYCKLYLSTQTYAKTVIYISTSKIYVSFLSTLCQNFLPLVLNFIFWKFYFQVTEHGEHETKTCPLL